MAGTRCRRVDAATMFLQERGEQQSNFTGEEIGHGEPAAAKLRNRQRDSHQ